MSDTTGTSGGIEWNSAKLHEYFCACQKKYNAFLEISDSLIREMKMLVNDPEHTGTEAEATKSFLSEVQIKLIEDLIYTIQLFEDKQENLEENFNELVDSAPDAILKSARLSGIITDFMSYYQTLKSNSSQISEIAQGLNRECSEAGSFTIPEVQTLADTWKQFVSEEGTAGFVPQVLNSLESFDTDHSTDITGSELPDLCEVLSHNLICNDLCQCLNYKNHHKFLFSCYLKTSRKSFGVSVPGFGHSDIRGLVTYRSMVRRELYRLKAWITVACAIID